MCGIQPIFQTDLFPEPPHLPATQNQTQESPKEPSRVIHAGWLEPELQTEACGGEESSQTRRWTVSYAAKLLPRSHTHESGPTEHRLGERQVASAELLTLNPAELHRVGSPQILLWSYLNLP